MRFPAAVGLALALACSTSCFSFNWSRTVEQRPVSTADLPKSGIGLDRCLELLGAPTYVWEHRVHGLICAWSWAKDRALRGSVRSPFEHTERISFSYEDRRMTEKGLVLWFDENWVLEGWRKGALSELVGERPPPATLEDIEG